MTASPLPAGTDVGDAPGGKFISRTGLFDTAGADALGLVAASPAAFSFLGRLKAIADNTDGIEGFLDGVEGLLTDLRTLLTTQSGFLDNVEGLLGVGNDAAALLVPARNDFAITPSDGAAITPLPRAVRVNVAGTVVYRSVDSAADVTINAAAGEVIQSRVQYIRATGTSATGFVGKA